jgi:hypothetical protein
MRVAVWSLMTLMMQEVAQKTRTTRLWGRARAYMHKVLQFVSGVARCYSL